MERGVIEAGLQLLVMWTLHLIHIIIPAIEKYCIKTNGHDYWKKEIDYSGART